MVTDTLPPRMHEHRRCDQHEGTRCTIRCTGSDECHGSNAFSEQDGLTTPRQNRLPSILSMYVDTLVAFSPVKEGFITQKKKYAGVGNAYLVGRVCRILKQSLFQITWLDSQFQNHVETLNLSAVQRGNANYRSLHGNSTGPGWGRLCEVDAGEEVRIDADMELLEEYMEPFDPRQSYRQR